VRILLDECIPRKLARELTGHEAATIASMGWRGVKNGELLRRIAEAGFDAMLTVDKNLQFQQRVSELPYPVVVMDSLNNSLAALRPCVPSVLRALANAKPGEVYVCHPE
jgi:predicted nuclease of predicted toxin-antitoxin system